MLWGELAGIAERLRQAVKKPLRHRAIDTHTNLRREARRDVLILSNHFIAGPGA